MKMSSTTLCEISFQIWIWVRLWVTKIQEIFKLIKYTISLATHHVGQHGLVLGWSERGVECRKMLQHAQLGGTEQLLSGVWYVVAWYCRYRLLTYKLNQCALRTVSCGVIYRTCCATLPLLSLMMTQSGVFLLPPDIVSRVETLIQSTIAGCSHIHSI